MHKNQHIMLPFPKITNKRQMITLKLLKIRGKTNYCINIIEKQLQQNIVSTSMKQRSFFISVKAWNT